MNNKKITLLVGTNGSGKTKKLYETQKSLVTDLNKTFFIETEIKFADELKDSTSVSGNTWVNFWKFISEITKIKYPSNYEEEFINKYEELLKKNKVENQEKFNLIKNSFDKVIESFNNDELLKEFISSNKNLKLTAEIVDSTIDKNILSPSQFIKITGTKLEKITSPSGIVNYFFIKTVLESLSIVKDNRGLEDFHLLIDEPERFCHPALIKKIALYIKEIGKKINITIATHSPILVAYIFDENCQLIKLFNGKAKEISNVFEQGYNPIRGIKRAEYLFANKVIIVEGENDEKLIDEIISKNIQTINTDFIVVNANGKKEILNRYNTISKIVDSENILIVFDKDNNRDVDYVNAVYENEKEIANERKVMFNNLKINELLINTKAKKVFFETSYENCLIKEELQIIEEKKKEILNFINTH